MLTSNSFLRALWVSKALRPSQRLSGELRTVQWKPEVDDPFRWLEREKHHEILSGHLKSFSESGHYMRNLDLWVFVLGIIQRPKPKASCELERPWHRLWTLMEIKFQYIVSERLWAGHVQLRHKII